MINSILTNAKVSYIHLENFKSFKNATFDLRATKKNAKKFAVIFGENGSGKSTIIESISFLHELVQTRCTFQKFEHFVTLHSNENYEKLSPSIKLENFFSSLNDLYPSISNLLSEVRSIDSDGLLSLSFGFQLNEYEGEYICTFDDEYITYERMSYVLTGRKTVLWEISKENFHIHPRLFSSNHNNYFSDVIEQALRYWGKHAFLALLNFEAEDKAVSFIDEVFSPELKQILSLFNSLNYSIKYWDSTKSYYNENYYLSDMRSGTISVKDQTKLVLTEAALTAFFRSIFTNIEKVFYKQELSNSNINYELMVQKKTHGKIIDIPMSQASSGTQELLSMLPYIVLALNGQIVFIDEFGTSLHEQLVPALIKAINENLSGQLIITSHHLSILDQAGLNGDAFYYITSGQDNAKQIVCTTNIEQRLHSSYNYRNRYLTRNEYHLQQIHNCDESYINFDYFIHKN